MEVIDTLQFTQHDGADTGANEDIPSSLIRRVPLACLEQVLLD
jgi:hypothetical protein